MTMPAHGQDQTYKVNGGSTEQTPAAKTKSTQPAEKSLGWGSNIQNAPPGTRCGDGLAQSQLMPLPLIMRSAPQLPRLTTLNSGSCSDTLPALPANCSFPPMPMITDCTRIRHRSKVCRDSRRLTTQWGGRRKRSRFSIGLLPRILSVPATQFYSARSFCNRETTIKRRATESRRAYATGCPFRVVVALTYQRQQRWDEAKRFLEMAKKRAPDNPEVARSLASSFLYSSEDRRLQCRYLRTKGIHNPPPDVKAELAYTYQRSGKPEEAAKLYAEAATAAPKDLNLQLLGGAGGIGGRRGRSGKEVCEARGPLSMRNTTACTRLPEKSLASKSAMTMRLRNILPHSTHYRKPTRGCALSHSASHEPDGTLSARTERKCC